MKKLLLIIAIIFFAFVVYSVYGYFSLFFESGTIHLIKNSNLYPVSRRIASGEDRYLAMFKLLKDGPILLEKLTGVNTVIPDEMQLIDVNISGDIVFLDFVEDIEQWRGSAHEVRLAIAQIVYTYTEIPEIKRVAFVIEGKKQTLILGSDGYVIDRPLTREDVNAIK